MPDTPLPNEQPTTAPAAPDLPGSRPTKVLNPLTRVHWWQRPVPVWWSILLGVACLLLGASTTLWAFGQARLDATRQAGVVPAPEQPASVSGATREPAAGQILPIATTAMVVPPASSAPTQSPVTPPLQPTVAATAAEQLSPLAAARRIYQDGLTQRDPAVFWAALALLNKPNVAPMAGAAELRSRLLYALDAMSGTVYLNPENLARWELADEDGKPLVQPIDLTVSDDALFVIDSGTLYRRARMSLPAAGGTVTLTAVITPGGTIGGYPVKEIVAADATGTRQTIYVLDKSGDIYYSEMGTGDWILAKTAVQLQVDPDPFLLNITTFADRLYALDPARNQIWRHPPKDGSVGVLRGTLPWSLTPGEPDVSSGLDLAIDGKVYVLLRDDSVVKLTPAVAGYYRLDVANGRSHIAQIDSAFSRPM
ncbi:MAG: hypothetical protein WA029_15510, partial [Anaerolineae bacterium]